MTDPPELGMCPFCQAEIPTLNVILGYETNLGPAVSAEYPEYLDVLNPE